ncbi:hypothetical protein [Streptomyces sp. NPDC057253]|uniref:hypothetical protein n=1 Tax=Streptomyces sp. NPDC057253 TaxID=3346069 RepID=UPI00362B2DEE
MTSDEITLLAVGFGLGAQFMGVLNMWWDMRDARRNAAHSRHAWRQAAGDRYLSSLRLYQLQQRTETRR